ncbi:MAG: hypothetical protein ACLS69_05855 [Butyricicoccus sp.]
MQIRHTRSEDLPAMQEIFADARAFMRETATDQWGDRPRRGKCWTRIRTAPQLRLRGQRQNRRPCVYDRRRADDRVIHGGAWLTMRCMACPPYRGGKGHARRGFVLHELVHGAVRQHPHRHARDNKPM